MPKVRTILLVDNDPQVVSLLESALRLKDYRVITHTDPMDALRYLKENIPDLILADVDRAQLDGFEFMQRVRETTRAAYAPFILMVTEWDDKRSSDGYFANVEAFLRKPFTVDELLNRVEGVFSRVDRARTARPNHDLEGRIDRFPFPDVVDILMRQQLSGQLVLSMKAEPVEGLVVFAAGDVVHATFGRLDGPAALLQLQLRENGAFAFTTEDELVVPQVSVVGSAVRILEKGYNLADDGMLRRIDVTNQTASRLFEALVMDIFPPATTSEMRAAVNLARSAATDSAPEEDIRTEEETDTQSQEAFSPGEESVQIDDSGRMMAPEEPSMEEMRISAEGFELEAEEAPETMSVYAPSSQLFPDDELMDSFSASALHSPDASAVDASEDGPEGPTKPELAGDPEEAEEPSLSSDSDEAMVTSSIVIPATPVGMWDETIQIDGMGISGRITALEDTEDPDQHEEYSESDESAVALVDSGPGPVERIFNTMREAIDADLLDAEVCDLQLSTVSGRPLVSTLLDRKRRDHVAEFSAQAIRFGLSSDLGLYAQLSAGELHLLVYMLPHRRLLTCLFEQPTEAAPFLGQVRDLLDFDE